MGFSELFIRRPVGTTLLAVWIMLVGFVAYHFLPVASLPVVELPTIHVSASRPGADPVTMATTIAAPLERRLGAIAGVSVCFLSASDPGSRPLSTSLARAASFAFSSSRMGFKDEVAYTDAPQPYGEIFVMRADGSHVEQLTDNQWEEGTPGWALVTPNRIAGR